MALVKILDKDFKVFQFVTEENKVYRIIEQQNGIVLGVKNISTKVIHPLSNVFYKNLYEKYRNTDILN